MAAATRVIGSQGLSAPTATIAKEAGVSNGSLFTYFTTKAELLNELYLELKREMSAAATKDVPSDGNARTQLFTLWRNWLRWAAGSPLKRRALARLNVSDDVCPETRRAANQSMAGVALLLGNVRRAGPMRDTPFPFIAALINSIADATIDFMIADPERADEHCATAFEVIKRMLI